jgi:hypothetical protein
MNLHCFQFYHYKFGAEGAVGVGVPKCHCESGFGAKGSASWTGILDSWLGASAPAGPNANRKMSTDLTGEWSGLRHRAGRGYDRKW